MYNLPALPKDNILEYDDDDEGSDDLDRLLEDEEDAYDPAQEAAKMSSDSDGTVQELRPKATKRRKRHLGSRISDEQSTTKQSSHTSFVRSSNKLATQHDELLAASLAYDDDPASESEQESDHATAHTKPDIVIESTGNPAPAQVSPHKGVHQAGTKYTLDAATVDLFTPEFDAMPLEIQYEIVMERRELNKNKSKQKAKVDVNGTSDTFSINQVRPMSYSLVGVIRRLSFLSVQEFQLIWVV
jgi:hypothetical protein